MKEELQFYTCKSDYYYSTNYMNNYRLNAGKQKKKASCLVIWLHIYSYKDRSV